MVKGLTPQELAARAARLKVVLTDCDGVLTDATVYCSAAGEALLRFSRRDGMGIERLKAGGIATVIVTREQSPIVEKRAEKLGVRLFGGVREKAVWLDAFLGEEGLRPRDVAYMGDDVNDAEAAAIVGREGLTAAPFDAEPAFAETVHFHARRPGGAGAFREFAELLLSMREGRKP